MEPRINIRYSVIAYDESYGGYGDNASKDFSNKDDAINYAKKLKQNCLDYPAGPQYGPFTIMKHITMDPISIKIEY